MKRGSFICRKASLIASIALLGLVVFEISCKKPVDVFGVTELSDFDTTVFEGFQGFIGKVDIPYTTDVKYSIENLGTNTLEINPNNGEVFTSSSDALDYERDSMAVGRITALHEGDVYKATITVKLINRLDYYEIESDTFYIDENPLLGQEVGEIIAVSDAGPVKIEYAYIADDRLAIYFDNKTNKVTVRDVESFNYERNKELTIFIQANDGNRVIYKDVQIVIRDLKDGLSLQERLDTGSKPFDLMLNEGITKKELYGKRYKGGYIFLFKDIGRKIFVSTVTWRALNFSQCGIDFLVLDTAIGAGYENTKLIRYSSECRSGPANVFGYSEDNTYYYYHLPSQAELRAIRENILDRITIDPIYPCFWTSNSRKIGTMLCMNFITKEFKDRVKSDKGCYVAVRSFVE